MSNSQEKTPKHARHAAPESVDKAADSTAVSPLDPIEVAGGNAAASGNVAVDSGRVDASAVEPKVKKKKAGYKPWLAGLLVIVLCAGGYFGVNAYRDYRMQEDAKAAAAAAKQAEQDAKQAESDAQREQEGLPTVKLVENPIDFTQQKRINTEIYAWIEIPGTKVNHAVLQSNADDNFYLWRDEEGKLGQLGAIYSQQKNAKDFSDPVTVLYGHYGSNDEYFATLHYFENKEFFDSHDTIYVYTPGHILTYKVIAAYEYDDRHILNAYDFSIESIRLSYFDSILHPSTMVQNVREGVTLSADSKVLQLSTCMSTYLVLSTRYIVTGVLANDQPTY